MSTIIRHGLVGLFTCWSSQQNVIIRVVKGMEDLSLDGIKMRKLVDPLESRVVQGCDWQRREIQEIRVRRMSLRQNQVLEGDGAVGLAADPTIRQGADVVLGWQRIKNRNGEHHILGFVISDLKNEKNRKARS